MSLFIRDARPDDLAAIVSFNEALARETEGKQLDRATLTRGVDRLLREGALGRYFIAERDGEVVGQIMITFEFSDWRCGVFWWIQSVYVRSDARRQGVFRALHEHVERLARADSDVRGLRLYVEEANHTAHATYTRLGMPPAGYFVCENDWSGAIQKASL